MEKTGVEVAGEILEFLATDGKPHLIAEIMGRVMIPKDKILEIEEILQFLAKYELIDYDKEKKEAVIRPDMMKLVKLK